MINKLLGRYRVVEHVGAGGMGVVYRAHDERLNRDVALKVLPASTVADEAARRRFCKEAMALSQLNHPSIATIYDFDTQEGVDFLVMEFLPGQGLDQRIAAGPLAEKEALRLALQMADGLSAAHSRGVVHRDLKPGNIRLTEEGRAKILDFGVAKLLRPAGDLDATTRLAETQGAVGTVPYMAPEQLRNERVDARTDIYSAGAVLYEMVTGQRPFSETHGPRLIDEILHQAPTPPSRFQARMSGELERVILKCLDKDPERRYQTAKELLVDLERMTAPISTVAAVSPRPGMSRRAVIATTAGGVALAAVGALRIVRWPDWLSSLGGGAQFRSLAVLPLTNLSGDPAQEFFADGMTEALTSELSKIGSLWVTARQSVMRYKGTKKSMPEIAGELRVDGLVDGSVLRDASRVRITAQLVDGKRDRNLWSQNYDRELQNILVLQAEVARAIAQQIRVALTPEEEKRLAPTRSVNPEAHEAYLRGVAAPMIMQAREHYERAIELDPNHAPALAGLARVTYFRGLWSELPPSAAFDQVRDLTTRALQVDDTLAQAHGWLALVKMHHDWDWVGAEEEFRRALQLNPSQADVRHDYAHFMMALGRRAGSVAESQRAVDLDPYDPMFRGCVGWHSLYARQLDEARDHALAAVRMEPEMMWVNLVLGWVYEQRGMGQEAIAALRKAGRAMEGKSLTLASLGHAYAKFGMKREAEEALAALRRWAQATAPAGMMGEMPATPQRKAGAGEMGMGASRYVSAYDLAVLHLGLGQKTEALNSLEKAAEQRDAFLVYVGWDPRFDPLRAEPRFLDLLRRMNLPQIELPRS